MVAKIVKASFPGHLLTRPSVWQAPYIFASPHSGRHYPSRFLSSSILDLTELRRSEDAYVDTLLPSPDEIGVPILTARFPRAFVDVNRSANEIDTTMFTTPPKISAESRSNRVAAGFGVIPKYAAAGRAIYSRRLSGQEGSSRLSMCYEPYHAALRGLIDECVDLFGTAIVIDWHSMPSVGASGQKLADAVLGNRYGASCDRAVCTSWEAALDGAGLTVRRNSPYAGGYVTSTYGKPAKGVHVLQIEINRGLYLDEARTMRIGARFRLLKERLGSAIASVISDAALPLDIAAE
ncbi:N-formylglutamate amidohydrolase [Parvularcula marina]|uniref:N-formylglutamate amidohydrolase n=1 Tax=Parvularcula marina TaxID=2292771 RepID=A0A371RKM8_9PROT|nr:N-formylglutamate amidohydrolase [Parvularcula marina]RFB06022.1 N-formylglutamate amidohydrolase [Parvularcula marina]